MAALKRRGERNRGVIVNVGSPLAYRSVPLQSIYCGAKSAIRGVTDSLRSEIIHDKLAITITMFDLPPVNTPQFDWAMNKMGRKTPRATATFGNAGCWFDVLEDVPLTENQRRTVKADQRDENAVGCRP